MPKKFESLTTEMTKKRKINLDRRDDDFTADQIESARLQVCKFAEDTTEARIFLDMLGLVPDPVRFPPMPHRPSGAGNVKPRPLPAALPSSGYGAVS